MKVNLELNVGAPSPMPDPTPVLPPDRPQAAMAAPGRVAEALLRWYDRHARDLPWRIGPADRAQGVRPDPYRVWLSEIMLQQTTVAAVKAYFERFTARWPSVGALAAAPQAEIMEAWAGLGYYARARNLHACARAVAAEHGGRFPATAAGLRALPGIGAYTAAAIASIAFDEPAPVVDGNVERVVTRLFAIGTPLPAARAEIGRHAGRLTPPQRPGDYAQAVMDLGATICTPRRPACVLCPLSPDCRARAAGTMELYPVKAPKREKPERRGAAFVAVRAGDGAVWLRRRPDRGLLGGMMEPPSTDWGARQDGATGPDAAPFAAAWSLAGSVSHVFTHFSLTLDVWRAEIAADPDAAGGWCRPGDLAEAALPTLMRRAVDTATGSAPPPSSRRVAAGRPSGRTPSRTKAPR